MLSVSAATVLSRATGYLRWMTQAAILANGIVAQAYSASSLLPSLLYELFLGGILYSIFIPVLVERLSNHGHEDARRLTNALFTVIVPLLGVVCALGIVFAGPLVGFATNWAQSENLSPEQIRRTTDLAVLLFRIFAVQMLFYSLSTIATGVLQAHRHFFLPTFAPVLNNLTLIASFVAYFWLKDENPMLAIYILGAGAVAGIAVMGLALVPTMLALGYVPRPQLGHPALLSTARLAGPMVILVAASVGFQLFGNYLATEFNAAAELSYAFVIFSLPYGVLTVAISTALMPELSERHARGDAEGYRETFSFGLRTMVFVIVPASVALITLAEPTVGVLLERGEFDASATQTVAPLLAAYSVGLLGYSVYFFLVRAFYSRQNTRTPAALNVLIFLLYAALAYGLSRQFGAVGVALAVSVAYAVLALSGLAATRKEIRSVDGARLIRSVLKVLAAGAAMYAAAWGGTTVLGTGGGLLGSLAVLTLVGGVSLAIYLGAAYLLRTEELKSALVLLRRRTAGASAETEDLG